MIQFAIPTNPAFALKLIKDLCVKEPTLDIQSFNVIEGIDYSNSFFSKPSDLLFGGGILGAIVSNKIKSKPICVEIYTKTDDLIEIYFDTFEGYYIVTDYESREYKTIEDLEKQLCQAIKTIYLKN